MYNIHVYLQCQVPEDAQGTYNTECQSIPLLPSLAPEDQIISSLHLDQDFGSSNVPAVWIWSHLCPPWINKFINSVNKINLLLDEILVNKLNFAEVKISRVVNFFLFLPFTFRELVPQDPSWQKCCFTKIPAAPLGIGSQFHNVFSTLMFNFRPDPHPLFYPKWEN